MQDKLIGIKEAAELLSLSEKTLRNWDNSGKFIAVKTEGGHRKYRLSDIHKYQNNDKEKRIMRTINQLTRSEKEALIKESNDALCNYSGLISEISSKYFDDDKQLGTVVINFGEKLSPIMRMQNLPKDKQIYENALTLFLGEMIRNLGIGVADELKKLCLEDIDRSVFYKIICDCHAEHKDGCDRDLGEQYCCKCNRG